MENYHRKRLRLKDYDYVESGLYFITICTKDRKALLSEIVEDDVGIVLKPYGSVAQKYILSIKGIDSFVIMPNHIHMIISINYGSMRASTHTQSVSQLIKSFKILVSKEVGQSIFQRSFFDHIIRNEDDYIKHLWYIENNPAKWLEDDYYIKN